MSSLADSGRDLLSLESINTSFPVFFLFFCVSADLCVNPSRLCVILFFRMNLEEAIIELWRQVLLEDAKSLTLSSECFPVRTTPQSRLRQVDFVFDGIEIHGPLRQKSNAIPQQQPIHRQRRRWPTQTVWEEVVVSRKIGEG
jgi:hypothetical protein